MDQSIGFKIRVAREKRGLYLYQLADRIHLSRSALSRLELGQVEADDDILCAIAQALRCPAILEERCKTCVVSRELRRLKTLEAA